MVVTGSGVPSVAYVGNDVSLAHVVSFREAGGVAGEVSIIEDQFLVWTKLINRRAPTFALKEFQNATVCRGEDWSSGRRGNIDRVVNSTFRSRIVERIKQLFRPDPGHGNDQIYPADKIRWW